MKIALMSPGDPVSAIAVAGLTRFAPLLNVIEFYQAGNNADSQKKTRYSSEDTIFRALNAANTPTAPTPTYVPITKKIVSFDASVDVTLEDRNIDVDTELATQTKIEAETASFLLQTALIESIDTTANAINGIRALVPVANVLATGMLVPVGNADEKVSFQQTAIEALLAFVKNVRGGAQFLLMNELMKVRFLTVAKALGYYRLSKDEVGAELDMIGTVPIIGAGYKGDGNLNLPFTETDSSSSVFAFRTGERSDLTGLTSVGVKGRYAGQIGNLITNNVNFDMNLALLNDKALFQSTGWKI